MAIAVITDTIREACSDCYFYIGRRHLRAECKNNAAAFTEVTVW